MSDLSSVRLVALDIDGTIIEPGSSLDALPDRRVWDAVNRLHECGIHVMLATGRMYPGTASVARSLDITQPLICQQGATVHELDGSVRHGLTIEPDIALDLYHLASERDWTLAWFDSFRYLITRDCEQARFFAEVSQVEMEVHPEPHLAGMQASGIDLLSEVHSPDEVFEEISRRYPNQLSLLKFPTVTAIQAHGASKGAALERHAQELGFGSDQVLAMGDSVNDVSMLAWAGHSASPAHCDAAARSATKEILDGSGIQGVVDKLLAVADAA